MSCISVWVMRNFITLLGTLEEYHVHSRSDLDCTKEFPRVRKRQRESEDTWQLKVIQKRQTPHLYVTQAGGAPDRRQVRNKETSRVDAYEKLNHTQNYLWRACSVFKFLFDFLLGHSYCGAFSTMRLIRFAVVFVGKDVSAYLLLTLHTFFQYGVN